MSFPGSGSGNEAGTETVLYSFSSSGAEPFAGLVSDASSNLYGTTAAGSASSFGTVFKLDPTGTKTLLHTFGGTDGAIPYAGLVLDTSGNLYGTTTAGGASSLGTAFQITLAPTFSLSASGLTPSTVSAGGSSTASVSITAGSTVRGSVALTCSVQPSPAMAPKCSITPGSIIAGSPAVLTVSTTAPTVSNSRPLSGTALLYALWVPLIGFTGVGLSWDKKWKGKTLALLVMFAGLLICIACGGGGATSSGGSRTGGTPTGAYVIGVTGTSATVHHSTTTTITVQ